MDDLDFIQLIGDLERDENIPQIANPLQYLSDASFKKYFRLTKESFNNLLHLVSPYLNEAVKSTDISPELKLLTALKFFGSGSYQTDVGSNLCLGISQPSTSRCIQQIVEVLNKPEFLNRFVRFPQTLAELNCIRQRFNEDFNFPGVIGCIDCTHIAIFPPKIEDQNFPEHIYVNRKGYHSINVQLICDSKLKILNVCAKYPGSTHDSFIWNNSDVQQLLRNLHTAGHRDYFLLGDSGYQLREWLLTPISPEPQPRTAERRYNNAHKATRSIIERVNGILKMRFRCLFKHRVLHYDPETSCRIINACVVLHNFCVEQNDAVIDDNINEEDIELLPEDGAIDQEVTGRQQNPELISGRIQRNRIIHLAFC